MLLILSIIIGYLLGSIPFGLVLTRLAGLGDIRKIGSGNIGATNVLRTGRKDLAALTVLCDAFKAGFAYLIFYYITPEDPALILGQMTTANVFIGLVAGISAILGHNFPVWLKFKGGKGVASSFGFIVISCPVVGWLAALTWLTTAFISKYSSLSAITAAILVPLYSFFFSDMIHFYFYTFIALLLLIRHHSNIARLIKGQEGKISFKKK